MTIPSAAKPTPIDLPNANVLPVEPRSGRWSMDELQRQTRLRNYVVGMGRIIPCSCTSAANVLSLIPNGHAGEDGESPLIEGTYKFGDGYIFVLDTSSTGSVTATVVPRTGTLPTWPAYINDGGSQAGNGDLTAGRMYIAFPVYSLNGGNGGFVIK